MLFDNAVPGLSRGLLRKSGHCTLLCDSQGRGRSPASVVLSKAWVSRLPGQDLKARRAPRSVAPTDRHVDRFPKPLSLWRVPRSVFARIPEGRGTPDQQQGWCRTRALRPKQHSSLQDRHRERTKIWIPLIVLHDALATDLIAYPTQPLMVRDASMLGVEHSRISRRKHAWRMQKRRLEMPAKVVTPGAGLCMPTSRWPHHNPALAPHCVRRQDSSPLREGVALCSW